MASSWRDIAALGFFAVVAVAMYRYTGGWSHVHTLGVVRDRTGKIVAHRSLIKLMVNPWLSKIGYYLATDYWEDGEVLGRIRFFRIGKQRRGWKWNKEFRLCDGDYVEKRRRVW